MSDTNHNLEVAKACGFDIESEPNAIHTCSKEQLDAYTARICAEKDKDHKGELGLAQMQIDIQQKVTQIKNCKAALYEAQSIIAMQAEALKELHDEVDYQIAENIPTIHRLIEENERAEKVISASSESVAAWEAKKLAEFNQDCARSHPHELMTPMCELRTQIARLTNHLATAEAEMEELQRGREEVRGWNIQLRREKEELQSDVNAIAKHRNSLMQDNLRMVEENAELTKKLAEQQALLAKFANKESI